MLDDERNEVSYTVFVCPDNTIESLQHSGVYPSRAFKRHQAIPKAREGCCIAFDEVSIVVSLDFRFGQPPWHAVCVFWIEDVADFRKGVWLWRYDHDCYCMIFWCQETPTGTPLLAGLTFKAWSWQTYLHGFLLPLPPSYPSYPKQRKQLHWRFRQILACKSLYDFSLLSWSRASLGSSHHHPASIEMLQVEPGRHLVICGHNGAGKPGTFTVCLWI